MRARRLTALGVLIGSCLVAPRHAHAAKATGPTELVVDWCATSTPACQFQVNAVPRIDADTNVVILVKHFNFVAFGLEYTVEEKVIEAYQALDKLWTQLLGIPFLKATPAEVENRRRSRAATCGTFPECLRR